MENYLQRKSNPKVTEKWRKTLKELKKLKQKVVNWKDSSGDKRKGIKQSIGYFVDKHAIVLLCAELLPDGLEKGVLQKLEIDHRGKTVTVPSATFIASSSHNLMKCRVFQMGESKSGKEVSYGVEQLFVRLYIVGKVSEWISEGPVHVSGEGVLICTRPGSLELGISTIRNLKPNDEFWSKRISVRDILIGGRSFNSESDE